jgi:hypothetical protein
VKRMAIIGALLVALAGCGLFAQLPLQPFDAKLEQAYTTNTTVRDLSTTALNLRAISSAEMQNIKNLNDETRRTLDLAQEGDERGLELAVRVLEAMETRLEKAIEETGDNDD